MGNKNRFRHQGGQHPARHNGGGFHRNGNSNFVPGNSVIKSFDKQHNFPNNSNKPHGGAGSNPTISSSSTNKSRSSPARKVGLINPRFFCFYNSLLQCLYHTDDFREYVLSDTASRDLRNATERNSSIPLDAKKSGCPLGDHRRKLVRVQEDLRSLFHSMNNCPRNALKPSDQLIQKLFQGRNHHRLMQDSHELFNRVMARSHEEVCPQADRRSEVEKHSFGPYTVFGGFLQQSVVCQKCHTASKRTDPVMEISLSFPVEQRNGGGRSFGNNRNRIQMQQQQQHGGGSQKVSVYDLLQHYFRKEHLCGENKYLCSHCKSKQNATKFQQIHQIPKHMVFHLKQYDDCGRKVNKKIELPQVIKMGKYTTAPDEECEYQLYATLHHSGATTQDGHYYSFTRDGAEWTCFDDCRVSRSSYEQATKYNISQGRGMFGGNITGPYMAFYELVKGKPRSLLEEEMSQKCKKANLDKKIKQRAAQAAGGVEREKGRSASVTAGGAAGPDGIQVKVEINGLKCKKEKPSAVCGSKEEPHEQDLQKQSPVVASTPAAQAQLPGDQTSSVTKQSKKERKLMLKKLKRAALLEKDPAAAANDSPEVETTSSTTAKPNEEKKRDVATASSNTSDTVLPPALQSQLPGAKATAPATSATSSTSSALPATVRPLNTSNSSSGKIMLATPCLLQGEKKETSANAATEANSSGAAPAPPTLQQLASDQTNETKVKNKGSRATSSKHDVEASATSSTTAGGEPLSRSCSATSEAAQQVSHPNAITGIVRPGTTAASSSSTGGSSTVGSSTLQLTSNSSCGADQIDVTPSTAAGSPSYGNGGAGESSVEEPKTEPPAAVSEPRIEEKIAVAGSCGSCSSSSGLSGSTPSEAGASAKKRRPPSCRDDKRDDEVVERPSATATATSVAGGVEVEEPPRKKKKKRQEAKEAREATKDEREVLRKQLQLSDAKKLVVRDEAAPVQISRDQAPAAAAVVSSKAVSVGEEMLSMHQDHARQAAAEASTSSAAATTEKKKKKKKRSRTSEVSQSRLHLCEEGEDHAADAVEMKKSSATSTSATSIEAEVHDQKSELDTEPVEPEKKRKVKKSKRRSTSSASSMMKDKIPEPEQIVDGNRDVNSARPTSDKTGATERKPVDGKDGDKVNSQTVVATSRNEDSKGAASAPVLSDITHSSEQGTKTDAQGPSRKAAKKLKKGDVDYRKRKSGDHNTQYGLNSVSAWSSDEEVENGPQKKLVSSANSDFRKIQRQLQPSIVQRDAHDIEYDQGKRKHKAKNKMRQNFQGHQEGFNSAGLWKFEQRKSNRH
ncbi:unnamed protein product [Amoebophrya sp. A120]|nr:unnamed protein product [Amoebophrya sp. A120]|eukprot:GSA120T00011553001.1